MNNKIVTDKRSLFIGRSGKKNSRAKDQKERAAGHGFISYHISTVANGCFTIIFVLKLSFM